MRTSLWLLFMLAHASGSARTVIPESDWEFSSTSVACFLWQPIAALDETIRQSTLVLGDLEFVAPSSQSSSTYYVRVTTTVEVVDQATAIRLHSRSAPELVLRPRRPGGSALRYVEFNADSEQAASLAKTLAAGNRIDFEFRVGLLKKIIGVVNAEQFSASFAQFIACTDQLAKKS